MGRRRAANTATPGARARWRSTDVEPVCAQLLETVARRMASLRSIIEETRPPVPRSLLNATCLGVLRHYKAAERALRLCGYRVPRRYSRRYWLAVIGAYEALYRRGAVPPSRVAEKTGLPRSIVDCLYSIEPHRIAEDIRDPLRRLAVKYSVPRWIVEELAGLNVPGGLEELLASFQKPTPIWLRVNTRVSSVERALLYLKEHGVIAIPDAVLHDMVMVRAAEPGAIARLPRSLFYPEDRAPAAAVHMLSRALGGRVAKTADFFSAPGNKAAHFSWLNPGAVFTAIEISARRVATEQRLHREEEVDARADYAVSDAVMPPLREETFDAAIVDPDCTSIGRLGHSPETRLFLEVAGRGLLRRVLTLQEAGLRRAAAAVRRGGLILYTTCTLTISENEAIVKKILDNGIAELVDVKLGVGVEGLLRGSKRFYPHLIRGTGGFAAVLRKL